MLYIICNNKIFKINFFFFFVVRYFSKQEYENQNMNDEYSYVRGRQTADSSYARITDWDINDSIIPRVNLHLLSYNLKNSSAFKSSSR